MKMSNRFLEQEEIEALLQKDDVSQGADDGGQGDALFGQPAQPAQPGQPAQGAGDVSGVGDVSAGQGGADPGAGASMGAGAGTTSEGAANAATTNATANADTTNATGFATSVGGQLDQAAIDAMLAGQGGQPAQGASTASEGATSDAATNATAKADSTNATGFATSVGGQLDQAAIDAMLAGQGGQPGQPAQSAQPTQGAQGAQGAQPAQGASSSAGQGDVSNVGYAGAGGGQLGQAAIDAMLAGQAGAGSGGALGAGKASEGAANDAATNATAAVDLVADLLGDVEKDALGEIGNISMGSAATTLSEILGKTVRITSPKVVVCSSEELFERFSTPRLLVKVNFKEGLTGFNLLVIKTSDAMVLADLMMGGDGSKTAENLTEMEISAASEAMNQMIGTASTSLASLFERAININPPESMLLHDKESIDYNYITETDEIVLVEFRMTIGDLLDTQIMQIMGVETAKEKTSLLLGGYMGGEQATGTEADASNAWDSPGSVNDSSIFGDPNCPETVGTHGTPGTQGAPGGPGPTGTHGILSDQGVPGTFDIAPTNMVASAGTTSAPRQNSGAPAGGAMREALLEADNNTGHWGYQEPPWAASGHADAPSLEYDSDKISLLLDIPLKVTVVLGRAKRPIKEVLGMTSGSIVELSALVDEPVEIQVNGTLVAKGEVVVVNENFGVRITEILSPAERLQQLKH